MEESEEEMRGAARDEWKSEEAPTGLGRMRGSKGEMRGSITNIIYEYHKPPLCHVRCSERNLVRVLVGWFDDERRPNN
jgi:hypothetical protein